MWQTRLLMLLIHLPEVYLCHMIIALFFLFFLFFSFFLICIFFCFFLFFSFFVIFIVSKEHTTYAGCRSGRIPGYRQPKIRAECRMCSVIHFILLMTWKYWYLIFGCLLLTFGVQFLIFDFCFMKGLVGHIRDWRFSCLFDWDWTRWLVFGKLYSKTDLSQRFTSVSQPLYIYIYRWIIQTF